MHIPAVSLVSCEQNWNNIINKRMLNGTSFGHRSLKRESRCKRALGQEIKKHFGTLNLRAPSVADFDNWDGFYMCAAGSCHAMSQLLPQGIRATAAMNRDAIAELEVSRK